MKTILRIIAFALCLLICIGLWYLKTTYHIPLVPIVIFGTVIYILVFAQNTD